MLNDALAEFDDDDDEEEEEEREEKEGERGLEEKTTQPANASPASTRTEDHTTSTDLADAPPGGPSATSSSSDAPAQPSGSNPNEDADVQKARELEEGLMQNLTKALEGDGKGPGAFLDSIKKAIEDMSKDGNITNEIKQALSQDLEELEKLKDSSNPPSGDAAQTGKSSGVDDALKSLSEGMNEMPKQNDEDPEDSLRMLLGELEKLDLAEDGKSNTEMDSFIDQMIGKMMSKEYLYPAVKEITGKFPEFLEKSKEKVGEKELEQYEAQYKCFQELCKLFEKDDGECENKKVVELMQKMQSYGPPPQEIMSGLLPGVSFDNEGMPNIPGLDAGGEGGNPGECVGM